MQNIPLFKNRFSLSQSLCDYVNYCLIDLGNLSNMPILKYGVRIVSINTFNDQDSFKY